MTGRIRALAAATASVLITLFGLIVVTFFIGRVMPIDPIVAIVGDRAPPDVVARVSAELGLNRPLWYQFWVFLDHLVHLNLGRSVMTTHLVIDDIGRYFPATFELATAAMIISTIIGVPLGVWAAVRQGTRTDHVVRVISLAGASIPVFMLAMVSLVIFYGWLGWLPGTGQNSVIFDGMVPRVTGMLVIDSLIAGDWGSFQDALLHLAQPALVLAYFSMAYITRMTRGFMLDALKGEYVTTARAKGLSATRIIWRHAFGNIWVQLITILALTYAGLLEGAVVTETVFSWPGLGQYLTNSLLNADMNAVLGSTLVIGFIYVFLNLFCDILYKLLDPRVR